MNTVPHVKRGRPSKFGRPSQVVALTLPEEVVCGLKRIHPDLAWAIVTLFETTAHRAAAAEKKRPNAELLSIAPHRSLIVVNRNAVKKLPGINLVPLNATQAFLVLAPRRGLRDLELAVSDRLDDRSIGPTERKALVDLQARIRRWRRTHELRFLPRGVLIAVRETQRSRRSATTA